jgi:hypothetical protein
MPQGIEPQNLLERAGTRIDDYTKLTDNDFKGRALVQLTYSSQNMPRVLVYEKTDSVCLATETEGVCVHTHYLVPHGMVLEVALKQAIASDFRGAAVKREEVKTSGGDDDEGATQD